MYRPACLDPLPSDLADSLLAQALESLPSIREHLEALSENERRILDDAVWRLFTAADVSSRPCDD